MSLLHNLREPNCTTPGIADKVLIALVDWFEEGGIKSPGDYVAFGDEVLIKDSHVLKDGRAFIECTLAPEKNSYDAKNIGDTGFQKFANQVNFLLPGSYADLHELVKDLLNKPVIILVKDIECKYDRWYQIGSSCVYAYIGGDFRTSTTKEGNKGYMLSASNTANKVYLYEGDITYTRETERLVARLEGSIVGTTVTLDALESTGEGDLEYEYEVMYNDADDQPQSIILPETGYSAVFDTSILVNWNNAGFAIRLTVTNGIDSDTTLSSDSSGERPVIMGGFDNGFDEGFDFNI